MWHGRRRARKKRRGAEVKEKFWRKKSEILWEIFKNRSRKRNRHKRKISQEKKYQGNQKICEKSRTRRRFSKRGVGKKELDQLENFGWKMKAGKELDKRWKQKRRSMKIRKFVRGKKSIRKRTRKIG